MSTVTPLHASARPVRDLAGYSRFSDCWALTKPEVNVLILITTFAGFYLGCASEGRACSLFALFNALFGTLLVASGTATLNQYIERDFDAQMRRTARRPLAAGRLKPHAVLVFGITLSVAGTIYLAFASGMLASLLALITLLAYLFVYTPLKRITSACVLVGAFPGAVPPLIGWAAATGKLHTEAWLLYAILFLWQFPHFMAIAWIYREDYDRAGYLVLPRGESRIPAVILQVLLPLVVLIPLGALQFSPRYTGPFLFVGLLLSLAFLYFGVKFSLERSNLAARRLLAASIVYLPLLFLLSAMQSFIGT
jgi:heme o synthase